MKWETKSIEDVFTIIDGDRGINYPKKTDFLEDGYCLFLNTSNVTQTGFDFTERQYISQRKDEQLRKGKLNRGDIVLTTRGTVGNIALFDEKINFNVIRINSGMVLLRDYAAYLVPHYFIVYIRQFGLEKYLSGSAQPQLPIANLRKVCLPLPPLSLQNEFAAFVEQVDKSKFVGHKCIKKYTYSVESIRRAIFELYNGVLFRGWSK
jgi:type I restriction enzyme S subunit